MDGSKAFVQRLSPRARVGFALGLVAIIVIASALAWWVFRPRYSLLFGHLHQSDAAEIVHSLDQWHVPYRFADNGASLLVPADQLYPTRMKLASSGVPHGGVVGFELFNNSDYGITEFAQRVNYLRALQGELERTIDSMSEVDTARVHLTLQRHVLFESSAHPAKGSVTVALRSGRRLTVQQVAGIQRLVASAVEGLKPDAVVVLDQGGDVLSGFGPENASAGALLDRMDGEKQIEARMARRVRALLRDALHTDRFSVSVNVRLNYDRIKEVRDELLPQGRDGNGLVVSEKRSLTPGATSSADGASGAGASSTTDIQYVHGREQMETVKVPGRIERVSVGVVIPTLLSSHDIDKLKAVVAAGLGLETQRGDQVDIATFAAMPAALNTTSTFAVRTSVIHATPPTEPATPLSVRSQRSIVLLGVAVAMVSAVLLLVGAMWVRGRRYPPRLSREQREVALARIQHWVNESEQVS